MSDKISKEIINNCTVSNIPLPMSICFNNTETGNEVGTLTWNEDEFKFKGNADESAKIFINYLKQYANEYFEYFVREKMKKIKPTCVGYMASKNKRNKTIKFGPDGLVSFCECVKISGVARDGKSTCVQCGGIDAYKKSPLRNNEVKGKIQTTSDIRYKAYKEMIAFVDWIAEKYPKQWVKMCEEYSIRK